MILRLALLGTLVAGASAVPATMTTRAEVKERLDLLVDARAFSPQSPLSQAELVRFVTSVTSRGDLPQKYDLDTAPPASEHMPVSDHYIMRSAVQRFVRDYLGVRLTGWPKPNLEGGSLHVTRGMIAWNSTSGNQRWGPPYLDVQTLKGRGANRVEARFVIHEGGNRYEDGPHPIIGRGTAVLRRSGRNWVVESWAPVRTKR